MNRLKILLQSNVFYTILSIIISIYIILSTVIIKYETRLNITNNYLIGKVISYKEYDDKITIVLESSEKVVVNYYDDYTKNLSGATIKVEGSYNIPTNNTVPNTFNYKKYLYNNRIYTTFTAENITILENNKNILNDLLIRINERIKEYKSREYLNLFILGSKTLLEEDMYNIYQENGVAHLLALSGLHIGLFIIILEKILFKVPEKTRIFITITFLVMYLIITNFLISIIRCVIFYILKKFNGYNLSNSKLLFLVATMLLIYNPFYIYDIGFLYSFLITMIIINIKNKNILNISIYSFLGSLPITAIINYEINLSSIVFNIILTTLISVVIYPLSILTFIFSFLDNIFYVIVSIFEYINIFCYKYLSLIIVIPKVNLIIIVLYYIALIYKLLGRFKHLVKFYILLLLAAKLSYKIDFNYHIYYFDIGQGDSSLLISPFREEIILIDTGGSSFYNVSENVLLFLKSINISKINILVLTHGDSDHILDAEYIIDNFKVENIMLNNNELNEHEENLLNKNIPIINIVDLNYFKSQNLNNELSADENASSLVFSFNIRGLNFLFTGDITLDNMNKIISKNNLTTDFLKLSHHGSKNNIDDNLIKSLSPKYSFISAGKNNIYNHPHSEVIDILDNNNVKTYITADNGTIRVKISQESFNIITYKP